MSMFHFYHVRASGVGSGGTGDGPGGAGGGGGGTAGAGENGGAISILGGPNGENGPLKNGFGGNVPGAGCIFDAITVPM